MNRFGIRRTVMGALLADVGRHRRQATHDRALPLFLTWGLLTGIGSGAVANVALR